MKEPVTLPKDTVIKTVTNLISTATDPVRLTKMSEIYCPWF
jgi:hypothetical protein